MTSNRAQQSIDIIITIAALMAKDVCQAQDIVSHLGQAQGELIPDVPLKVKPFDPVFSAARVAHRSETSEPTQVTLDVAETLPMASLVAAFGPYDTLPRRPNTHELPRVSFNLQIEQAAHEVTLFASYESDDANADTSTVRRLMLFRD